jgi:S-methylmethionine-dependent homocysteine/selenocysteine methylase
MSLFSESLFGPRPLLLDAAMGTELERLGAAGPAPLWSARALVDFPDAVARIHAENAASGADILTANTFRTHRRSLEAAGLGDRAGELTRIAIALARSAAAAAGGRSIFVAGSLAPLEDCYRPDLVPDNAALAREHGRQARTLAEAGVDAIFLETHNTVRELVAAARAARETGLPVTASMVTDGAGRLLSGESIEAAVAALAPLAPDAVAINCVPARQLLPDLERLAAAAREHGLPVGAWGNLGRPSPGATGGFADEASPDDFARCASEWIQAGARIVGGCCGTQASHTAALRRALEPENSERITDNG